MYKEILICIAIAISIFTLDKVTQNYTDKQFNLLQGELMSIREEILSDTSKEEVLQKMEKLEDDWEETFSKTAYYIEHDELEKVETKFTTIRSYIEMDDKTMTISTIDESSFIIEHIRDKNSFNLQNIF